MMITPTAVSQSSTPTRHVWMLGPDCHVCVSCFVSSPTENRYIRYIRYIRYTTMLTHKTHFLPSRSSCIEVNKHAAAYIYNYVTVQKNHCYNMYIEGGKGGGGETSVGPGRTLEAPGIGALHLLLLITTLIQSFGSSHF